MYTYFSLSVISTSTQKVIYQSALVTSKTLMELLKGFVDEEDNVRFEIAQYYYDKPLRWVKDDVD